MERNPYAVGDKYDTGLGQKFGDDYGPFTTGDYGLEDDTAREAPWGATGDVDSDLQRGPANNALHAAANTNKVQGIHAALRRGAQVDCLDDYRMTPMMWAAQKGYREAVRALQAAGANVNVATEAGATALLLATEENHPDVITDLLVWQADIDHVNSAGDTALHLAARNGHFNCVSVLLRYGADSGIKNKESRTPLDVADDTRTHSILVGEKVMYDAQMLREFHRAAHAGKKKRVDAYLRRLSASKANEPDHQGRTALHWASDGGRAEIVDFLLEQGGKPNVYDSWGFTPLHRAVLSNAVDAVRALIKGGADVRAKSPEGQTPMELAKDSKEMQETLSERRSGLFGKIFRSKSSTPGAGGETRKMANGAGGELPTMEGEEAWKLPSEEVERIRLVGGGTWGDLYSARWRSRGVAVRVVRGPPLDVDLLKRISQELQGLPVHDHLVRMLGVIVEEGGDVHVVTEFVVGDSLTDHMYTQRTRLHLDRRIAMASMIASGIAHLHKYGVWHGQVAARNVMVAMNGTCKITDYSILRGASTTALQAGGTSGLRWMAPEALKTGKASGPADIWSFGVLLYELMSLQSGLPFLEVGSDAEFRRRLLSEQDDILPVPEQCPVEIEAIMRACWHRNPALRPSASSLAFVLDEERWKQPKALDMLMPPQDISAPLDAPPSYSE